MTGLDISPDTLGARLDKSGECWVWTGSRLPKGYGTFSRKRHGRVYRFYAHRVALELAEGRVLGPGECALHRCDNPPCCRPEHLFRGTKLDNNRDTIAKGRRGPDKARGQPGEANNKAKLTSAQVIVIRGEYNAPGKQLGHIKALAAQYGVSRNTIRRVATGEHWSHL